ncbi:MAG: hypothetical protein K0R17_2973 [Rariglobus sp.]|jgi:uncharacterized protein (TIGR02597 family)|nr:hypothetical protein [Rariglobus sp.]
MSTMLIKNLLGMLTLGLVVSVSAVEISSTPPAGYFKLTAQGASDSLLALPLARRTAWMGRVTARSASQVTLATAAAVETGASAPSATGWYYAEFVTGALAGLAYPVTGNTGGSFLLETYGDDLTDHALGPVAVGESGDIVRIRAGWSLAHAFGSGDDLQVATSPAFTGAVYLAGDAVLLPDNASTGTEKKPAGVFAYVAGSGWRQRGGGEGDAGGQALLPSVPFTVRRQSSVPAEVLMLGYVNSGPRVVRLPGVPAGGEVDFAITWGQGSEQTLGASGLATVINASPDALSAADLLLDYRGFRRGFTRPPEHAFSLLAGHWFEADVDQDGFILSPGTGYLLRLRGERPVRYWVQPIAP